MCLGFVKSLLGGGSGAGFKAQGADPRQMTTAYNQTQEAIKQQQDFVNALKAQNGLGNQSNVFQQQQGTANQLQDVANGVGPNPAQAMLNQATGQNVSNQAALMAGQRGASANTGLIARQAAQQGANTQQQAVGQGATMQAQQSLGALGQLQQQQANMGSLATQQVGQQQTANATLGQESQAQHNALLGLQQNANNTNAQIAAQNAQGQMNLLGNIAGGIGSSLMTGGMSKLFGGAAAGASGASLGGGMMLAAEGGKIEKKGPKSNAGKHLHGHPVVKTLLSPGEVALKPKEAEQVAAGKKSAMDGEKIKGKAKVPGAVNDYANDTVRKDLPSGSVVIPRSITQAANKDKAAADFVAAVLARKGKK